MYQRRRARILLALLALTALVLVTIDVRADGDGAVDRARGLATAAFRPLQDGVGILVRPLADGIGGVGDLFRIRADNVRLRDEVDRLSERQRSMTDLQRENAELRALLEIGERGGYETVAARAVALAPSTFEWTVTIDVGSNDGVERDMPVIAGDGLVGRVIQVTPGSARVLLAIDPSFSAAARTARVGAVGPIEGRGGDPMIFRPLDPSADIAIGDEIVTSAYQGGVFPAGIPVGVVADAGDPQARLSREVTVRPLVDFTRVHHVLVVLAAPVEAVPPLVGTPDLEFTPPPVPRFLEVEDLDADGDDGAAEDGDSDTGAESGDAEPTP